MTLVAEAENDTSSEAKDIGWRINMIAACHRCRGSNPVPAPRGRWPHISYIFRKVVHSEKTELPKLRSLDG